jgi:ABC-2 type transport system permease protein
MSRNFMNDRVLRRVASTAAGDILASRSALAIVGVFDLMVTGVLAALWIAATRANGGEIAGYTSTALVWYVATSEAATVSLPMRMIETIGDDIVSERIAIELLRPASVIGTRIATEVGRMLPRVAVCIAVGAALAAIVVGAPPSIPALCLALPSLLLALAANVVAQHAFAAAAFWVRDAKGAWFLYQKLVFVLGGMLIPLELLPGWLENTARVLPFASMAYAPARLASGHVEPRVLVIQLAWLTALCGLAAVLFARGERRLIGASA